MFGVASAWTFMLGVVPRGFSFAACPIHLHSVRSFI